MSLPKGLKSVLVVLLLAVILIPTLALAVYGNSENLDNTGEAIVRIQTRLRDLGFFLFKPTGRFQGMTTSAVIEFQKLQLDDSGNAIMTDGTIGEQSMNILFSQKAQRSVIPPQTHIPIGPSGSTYAATGVIVSWNEVKPKLESGKRYQMTDCVTGKSFTMVMVGGEKHAEMECASSQDTDTFLSVFGDCFNFSKRAMVLALDGQNIICSMQGNPHGEDTVSGNNMNGAVCVYFDGSTSHVGNMQDVEHLNKIYGVLQG